MTTQVKAIAGKASTAIPAGGVYANDTIARHDPGSLAEDYAELVSCCKKTTCPDMALVPDVRAKYLGVVVNYPTTATGAP